MSERIVTKPGAFSAEGTRELEGGADTSALGTINRPLRERGRRGDALLFVVLFCTLLGLTPLLILSGVAIGFSLVLGSMVVLLLTISIMRWPSLGLFVVAGCVFLFEQEPLSTPILTDNLYIFHWPVQLEGFIERPIGVLMLFSLLFWMIHRLAGRQRGADQSAVGEIGAINRPLLVPFALFMLCVVGGAVYGLVSGGDLKIIVVQFRPFWYLFVSYLMAYNFVTRKRDVHTFFWLAILGAGVKAVQGLYVYLIVLHGNLQGQDTILSHEESFFFAALILLVIILLMCRGAKADQSAVGEIGAINRPPRGGAINRTLTDTWRGARKQLVTALLILPAVVVAMVANQRRTDYVALLVGVGVAWVLVFLIRPQARKRLVVGLLICVVLGTGYVIAFAHSSGTLASPARGILSVFSPGTSDTRDASSNLYRVYEDNDLKYTVKQYPLGLGFGKPFLQPLSLTSIFPNILAFDPYYNYVPHNTIYWVWVDLGPMGYLALWLLIGSIIVRGCVILRGLRDRYLQVVAIYIVAVTFMEIVVAFADYQLFFYRNVIYLGLLCGMLVKLPMLDSEGQGTETRGIYPERAPARGLTVHHTTPAPTDTEVIPPSPRSVGKIARSVRGEGGRNR